MEHGPVVMEKPHCLLQLTVARVLADEGTGVRENLIPVPMEWGYV